MELFCHFSRRRPGETTTSFALNCNIWEYTNERGRRSVWNGLPVFLNRSVESRLLKADIVLPVNNRDENYRIDGLFSCRLRFEVLYIFIIYFLAAGFHVFAYTGVKGTVELRRRAADHLIEKFSILV